MEVQNEEPADVGTTEGEGNAQRAQEGSGEGEGAEAGTEDGPSKGQGKKGVICGVCKAVFANVSSLKRHVARYHNKSASQCDTCGQFFTSEEKLSVHTKAIWV